MIASRPPSDQNRPEELEPPSAAAAATAADAGGGGGASRAASAAAADTAVSSMTFASSGNEDGNIGNGNGRCRQQPQPPSRSYGSFASDTSFVIERNDDGCRAGETTNNTKRQQQQRQQQSQPLVDRVRRHFASHQTGAARSESGSGGGGSPSSPWPPAADADDGAAAPAAPAPGAGGRPPRSTSSGAAAPSNSGGGGSGGGSRQKPPPPAGPATAAHLLLAPLRHRFASRSREPSAISHLRDRPAPSGATLAHMARLIRSKRRSLRPVELHFLEEVCLYGAEDEVWTAMRRLEDDGLFFACGGAGGGDDGDGDGGDGGGDYEEEEEVEVLEGHDGEARKASPRRWSMVREEKKLDGGTTATTDDEMDDEDDMEEEEYTAADRNLYTELTASGVDARELEQMNRQLKMKRSMLAADVVDDDNDDDASAGADAAAENGNALASRPLPLASSASMYEPRAVRANSLDPSESDLERQVRARVRSSSEGVADDVVGDDDAKGNVGSNGDAKGTTSADVRIAAAKKARARRTWTKLGSAARMAALANRRAQHRDRARAARSVAAGGLPEAAKGSAVSARAGVVDAVPGPGGGTTTPTPVGGGGESQTSTTSTSNIASIWRAHETGLSVTSLSSERRIDQKRRSMLQLAGVPRVGSGTIATAPPLQNGRRSVVGGGGGGGGAGASSSRRAAYRNAVGGDSFLSVGSLGDVLVDTAGKVIGPTTHNAEEDDKVFRRQEEDAVFRPDGDGNADEKLEDSDDELFADEIEENNNGLNTSTASAPVPESPSKIARPAGIGSSDGEGGMNRRSISVGSVRSVKFAGGHTLHEFSEDDMQFNKIEISGDRPPPSRLPGRPPTILRRSSSLNRLPPSARRQVAVEMSRGRLLSADVTPVSSPSAGSIPSIRHAHPIRSDSALSLGSVGSAAPSLNLHRANPLRSDSFMSVSSAISAAPSLNLHRANPIRSNSALSMGSAAPSLNLHRANPVRSQSFLSEIGDVGFQRNISVADSVLTFDESPITSPRASMSADEPEDEAVTAAKAAAAAAATKNSRPVMMRMASENNYNGEGFEIADMVEDAPSSPAKSEMLKLDSIDNARKYRSLLSEASESMLTVDRSFKAMPIDDFVRSSMFRRTLSDDGLYGDNDSNGDLFDFANENDDWDLESEPEIQDAWNVLQDEYAVGYSSIPFFILGTSADDIDCHPHVLSPPLMESLQPFFPYAVSEDNFYLKFSLVRDGASLHTLLQNVRGAKHTIVAIETVEGEVFGAFCSSAWRKNWNYFGSGEAFLWRMRRGRDTHCPSIIDQAQMESELDVFPWTGENNFVQLCTSNKIAIGGGTKDDKKKGSEDEDPKMELAEGDQKTSWDMEDSPPFGFGLAIEDNLLNGMSSPCLTFNSPPLSKKHADGSPFEILNLEVWTLTPCNTVEEAEKLELSRLFLESHRATSM